MKIGKFAKKYNIPISSVRHYINLGILSPERHGKQFNFQNSDHETMELVNTLKAADFSLKEINTYVNTLNAYAVNDNSKYLKLISLLRKKEIELLHIKQQLDDTLQLVTALINEHSTKLDAEEMHDKYGVHLGILGHIACPKCGNMMQLEKADIFDNQIFSGIFRCSCGYTAHVDDGILFTDIDNNLDLDQEFVNDYFGDDIGKDYDSPFFEAIKGSTAEHLAIQHKSREWLNNFLTENDLKSNIILFPDIAFQFLYLYPDHPCFKDSLLILHTLSKRSAEKMRSHLQSLNTKLNIAIIVSPTCSLPMQNGCIDLVIDYLGSFNYSFYKKAPYISCISHKISDTGCIAAMTDYFAQNSDSAKMICSTYKNAISPRPDFTALRKILAQEGFHVVDDELIGFQTDSGSYFEYHMPGDKRYTHAYYATRK